MAAITAIINLTNNRTGYKCTGFEKITVDNTVKTLTVPANTLFALISLESNPIRIRMDGSNPSTTDGMLISVDTVFIIEGKDALVNFKTTRQGASDGIIQVHYFGV